MAPLLRVWLWLPPPDADSKPIRTGFEVFLAAGCRLAAASCRTPPAKEVGPLTLPGFRSCDAQFKHSHDVRIVALERDAS